MPIKCFLLYAANSALGMLPLKIWYDFFFATFMLQLRANILVFLIRWCILRPNFFSLIELAPRPIWSISCNTISYCRLFVPSVGDRNRKSWRPLAEELIVKTKNSLFCEDLDTFLGSVLVNPLNHPTVHRGGVGRGGSVAIVWLLPLVTGDR